MKHNIFFTLIISLSLGLAIQSCGPVVISSRPDAPPPPWFYPNRVEVVRYVYFPDYNIYYDISLRHYLYFENNIWVTVSILPPRFGHINFNRARYIRIRDFQGDNIRSYHSSNRYYNPRRSTRSTYNRTRSTTRRSRSTTTRARNTSTRSRTDYSRSKSRDSLR